MKAAFSSAAFLLGLLIVGNGADAGTLVRRTLAPGPDPGSRARDYEVFVPERLSDPAAAPVVMVLHGCLQTEQNMIKETGFTELAERDGFIAVFPFIKSYPFLPPRNRNCWGFFIEQQRHEGLGEPADLRRIFDAVEDEFPVDPERRYVAGLSSGAAMAVVMAVAYSEDIAAAGAVAGLPYGEDACAVQNACFTGIAHQPLGALVQAMQAEQQSAEERRLVPIMVIHSTNDMVVPLRQPVINTARGNFQEHILAGRITVQRPPCVVGLGVCDADFNTLFFQHGFEAFALYNPAGSERWYVDPANIPPL